MCYKCFSEFTNGTFWHNPIVLGWEKLCLLLDYDGTLAPHGSHPDFTILPQNTREVQLADKFN